MQPANVNVDVLIVGAGPTGLTLACELLRRGITCRILDKIEAPRTTSRAIGLQARSLEIFANMGIVEPALAQGVAGIRVNAYNGEKHLFRLDFRFLVSEGIPYPYGILLPQDVTERILLDLLHQEGGDVERAREVIDLRQESERVFASVRHLQDGSSEEITASWLVGCDGAHSSVRKAVGLGFEGKTYPEEFLLADVDLDWQRSHDEVHVWMHSDGQLAAMPLPANHWRLIADIAVAAGQEAPQASLELFQRLLRERAGDTTTTISHAAWISNFQIHRRLVTSYRQRRVLLAGDAAHAHSPFGGQGANTGMQDAFNLAWKLALVIRGKASETLVDSYEEERRPVARKVLAGTNSLTSIFYSRNPLVRILRDRVVLPLLKQQAVQSRLLWEASELGINYRASSLSQHVQEKPRMPLPGLRGKSKLLHAGDRAPDGHCLRLPGRAETTLFHEWQNPPAQLLLFDGRVQTAENYAQLIQLARRVEEQFAGEVKAHLVVSKEVALDWEGSFLYDSGQTLHTRYGVYGPSLCVIRPDGYIGLLCQPIRTQPLVDYLQRIYSPSPQVVRETQIS